MVGVSSDNFKMGGFEITGTRKVRTLRKESGDNNKLQVLQTISNKNKWVNLAFMVLATGNKTTL